MTNHPNRSNRVRAAIGEAEKLFGPVYRVSTGPTGWGYNSWDESRRVWYMPQTGDTYLVARAKRATSVAAAAAEIIEPIGDEYSSYESLADGWLLGPITGTVADRVAELLQRGRAHRARLAAVAA